MSNLLIDYTHKEEIATSYKAFKAYIGVHSKINPNLSEMDIMMIKQCIEDDLITVGELELAIKQAYKDPERFGKVEWNHVWKWVKKKRDETFNPKYAKQLQNAFK